MIVNRQSFNQFLNGYLAVIQDIAPTGEDFQKVVKEVKDIQRSNTFNGVLNMEGAIRRMSGLLYDGLAFGNWPWTAHTVEGFLAARDKMHAQDKDKA